MAHDADANKSSKGWLWLLLLPWIAMIWVPSYNKIEPVLFDFPFFYWYQLILVPVTAILCWISYLLLRTRPARQHRRAPEATARDREGGWR